MNFFTEPKRSGPSCNEVRSTLSGPSFSKADKRLTQGLTRVSFSFIQKHFLGQFSLKFIEHRIINLLTKRIEQNLLYKLSDLNSNFAPTLGYLNPPLNIPALNGSLRCRRNLTPVSNVCEAAPKSLFCAPNGLNELPEVCFQFPFILIGKWTKAFLKSQSWHVLKSRYTVGDPEQGFRRRFADRLNQNLVSSVVRAI